MRIGRIHLHGPCATLVVLRRIPQGWDPGFHEEEHAGFPHILGNAVNDSPELIDGLDLVHLDVTVEGIVAVVGIVIPESPHFCHTVLLYSFVGFRFSQKRKLSP